MDRYGFYVGLKTGRQTEYLQRRKDPRRGNREYEITEELMDMNKYVKPPFGDMQ